MPLDFSTVKITNAGHEKVQIWGLSDICYSCSPQYKGTVDPAQMLPFSIDGRWPYTLTFQVLTSPFVSQNVTYSYRFGDQGTYELTVGPGVTLTANIVQDPNTTWFPLLAALAILAVLYVIIPFFVKLFDILMDWVSDGSPIIVSKAASSTKVKDRVLSLDTFRGLSLSIMIFVNYGGGGYWWLNHSVWDGLTVADLVFPWFIFMMGVSLALVQDSQSRKKERRRVVMWRITRRSCAMFWLGLFLDSSHDGGIDVTRWRIPGVLQRFAISYFVNAVAIYWIPAIGSLAPEKTKLVTFQPTPEIEKTTRVRLNRDEGPGSTGTNCGDEFNDWVKEGFPTPKSDDSEGIVLNPDQMSNPGSRGSSVRSLANESLSSTKPSSDVTGISGIGINLSPREKTYFDALVRTIPEIAPYVFQWAALLLIHFIWYIATFSYAAPGCPKGYIGPGGLADQGMYPNCTGGMALYWDVSFFGINHIYKSPTCKSIYHTGAFDPEGMLGSLNSIFLCFLGVNAGRIIVKHKNPMVRIQRWAVWCVLLSLLGGSLCGFQQYGGAIPVNKNLWSASFIYVMSGTGCGVLALLYYIVDVCQWWSGAPFYFPGMNSIVVYFCSEVFQSFFPMSFQHDDSHEWELASDLIGVACWILLAFVLYRRKTFISL